MTKEENCAILFHRPFDMTDIIEIRANGTSQKYMIKNNMSNLVEEITNWVLVEKLEKIYVKSEIPFAEELALYLQVRVKVEDMK